MTESAPPPSPSEHPGGVILRTGFGAAGAGAFSVLLVGSLFALPIVGVAIAPLGAVPVLHYQAAGRSGLRAWGGALVVLAAAAFLPVVGPVAGALLAAYLLVVVVPVVAVAWWRRLGWSEGRWAAVAVGVAAGLAVAGVLVGSWPESPVEGSRTWTRGVLEQAESLSTGMLADAGDLELDAFERSASWLLPAVPTAYLVLVLFWVRPRLQALGYPMRIAPFEEYRSEELLPVAFAVTGAATLLLEGTPRWLALNLLVAVVLLYFVHGLAIIRAHLARFVGRRWYVRWGVALVCLTNPLPLVVALLGLADSFFDLRPRPRDDGGAT